MAPKRAVRVGGAEYTQHFQQMGFHVNADLDAEFQAANAAIPQAASSSADADQVVPAAVVEDVATSASADVSYLSHTVAQILNQEGETDDDEPEDDETEGRVAPKAKAKAKGKAAAKVKGAAKAKVKGAAKAKAKAKAKAPPLPPLTGTAKNLERINVPSLRGLLTLLHVDTDGLNKRSLIVALADLLGDLPEEAAEEEVAEEEVADEEEDADE